MISNLLVALTYDEVSAAQGDCKFAPEWTPRSYQLPTQLPDIKPPLKLK